MAIAHYNFKCNLLLLRECYRVYIEKTSISMDSFYKAIGLSGMKNFTGLMRDALSKNKLSIIEEKIKSTCSVVIECEDYFNYKKACHICDKQNSSFRNLKKALEEYVKVAGTLDTNKEAKKYQQKVYDCVRLSGIHDDIILRLLLCCASLHKSVSYFPHFYTKDMWELVKYDYDLDAENGEMADRIKRYLAVENRKSWAAKQRHLHGYKFVEDKIEEVNSERCQEIKNYINDILEKLNK